uniref:uncharacterized protein LOC120335185 n=1 Tax=Styela clava TaxID=7725 RepID=UPI00193A7C06|nr:uncharacterized protein LOC120335185 [Styela clava]
MMKNFALVLILVGIVTCEDESTSATIAGMTAASNSETLEDISKDLKNTELDLRKLREINKIEKDLIDEALSASDLVTVSLVLLEAQIRINESNLKMELLSKATSEMAQEIDSLINAQ